MAGISERWKRYERARAKLAGWLRIPVTGRQGIGGDPGDLSAGPFYVEVRDRERPRPVRWFRETALAAEAHEKIPLVLFKGPAPHLSPLLIMRWSDFVEVLNRANPPGNPKRRPGGKKVAAETAAHGGDTNPHRVIRSPAAPSPGPEST